MFLNDDEMSMLQGMYATILVGLGVLLFLIVWVILQSGATWIEKMIAAFVALTLLLIIGVLADLRKVK